MWLCNTKGSSGFSSSSTADEVTEGIDASGLTAIVTGASSGIGTEMARVLALRGVHVTIAVRNMAAGQKVREAIVKEIPEAKIDVMELDLSSMASVRRFASEFNSLGHPLNILINNAGIMGTPFKLSQDNIELQFATNHLGHFLLTNLLLDTMKKTYYKSKKEGRIVNVSSDAHRYTYREGIRFDRISDEKGYSSFFAYCKSKLANLLHSYELARRFKLDRAAYPMLCFVPNVKPSQCLTDTANSLSPEWEVKGRRGGNNRQLCSSRSDYQQCFPSSRLLYRSCQ
ncbi:short-chain dehydrogenase TIC 32, chloroplastic-like isoform X2 [Coffea eugenioides]|uniref:short-chain dehydrogenase TIC 32, chloroplastic-like isoform X2 n=1 Tax=Coffea eugenioides TaxID=49369 RepID=UPI000F60E504|nr:short-chain dehydrogenase TIC 32, chloroplastic-like isoform X2 [Coffea eugenioides]